MSRAASIQAASIQAVVSSGLLAGILAFSGPAQALTNAEIANLSGPDRQKVLEEGAKKEGEMFWYTTLQVDEASGPISKAFMKKYPFVKVDVYRGTGVTITQRLQAENQAKKMLADLVVFNAADGRGMVKAGMTEAFVSPIYSGEYPPDYVTTDRMSGVVRVSQQGIAYNTSLVNKNDAPATWDDLLKPRFKGKMAWSESTGTGAPFMVTYFRLVLGEEKGLDYLKRLAAQDIRMVGATARLVLDQVIAGEYEVGVSMSVTDVADSMGKGAPVAGVLPEPVLSQTTTVQFVKGAPHPHAAALFIDFLASKDGGQLQLRDGSYTPAHPQVEPLPAMRWTVPRLNGKKEMVEDAAKSQEMQASSADILSKLFR